MKNSNFASVHGMYHIDNYSTAYDIAMIAKHALEKHKLLETICNTKHYSCLSTINTDMRYNWANTNLLLWESSGQYFGVKTGTTPKAGNCLCVNFKNQEFEMIAVVLNCRTKDLRFIEIPKLVNWAIRKIIKIRQTKFDQATKLSLLKNMAHV